MDGQTDGQTEISIYRVALLLKMTFLKGLLECGIVLYLNIKVKVLLTMFVFIFQQKLERERGIQVQVFTFIYFVFPNIFYFSNSNVITPIFYHIAGQINRKKH